MMQPPQITRLSGNRLHLHHGPIDIVLWAEGSEVTRAYAQAIDRFDGILVELVAELPKLRSPDAINFEGPIAKAMACATAPFTPTFITPMAAVAGAVADAVMGSLTDGTALTRAYVNNGGDIALHLARGQSLTAAIAHPGGVQDRVTVSFDDKVRGIATSGWHGRSFSLGIADAVTVVAATAAAADAAATMIANAVDLPGHPAIVRKPANSLQADSDLGERRVTTAVGPLTQQDVSTALDLGIDLAESLRHRGLVAGAALFLQSSSRTLGFLADKLGFLADKKEPALV